MQAARPIALTLATGIILAAAHAPAQVPETNQPASANRRVAHPGQTVVRATRAAPSSAAFATNPAAIPPAPSGVTDLKFSELFQPIGPRGLEYSDKLRALDGRRVRLLGNMVKQSRPLPWTLLLSPVPVTLHETEYGFAEDLPANVVHVFTERNATPLVPFTPGLLLLTGTLSVGNREEPDGRVSAVRLALDPPTPEQRAARAQLSRLVPTVSTNAVTQ